MLYQSPRDFTINIVFPEALAYSRRKYLGQPRTLLVAAVLHDGWCSSARICRAAFSTKYSWLVLIAVWSRLGGVQWAIWATRYNQAQQQTCSLQVSDWHLRAWSNYISDFQKGTDFYWIQTSNYRWLMTPENWQRLCFAIRIIQNCLPNT